MSHDPSKLPAAPLIAWTRQQSGAAGDQRYGGLTNAAGWCPLVSLDHATALDADFVAVVALLYNTQDIQMRRGWTARKLSGGEGWLVQDSTNTPLLEQHLVPGHLDWFVACTPALALDKADKWHKEHLEGGKQ